VSSFLGRIAGAILGPISEARRRSGLSPRLGAVDWGDLRRTSPVSDVFGFDRGTPIDRYYIEAFLQANASAIRGRVLEIGDRTYTERFGGDAVTASDVLHVTGDSPDATIVADLTHAPEIADGTFDCVIITQTLQFTYDMEATVAELHRILAPGGVVLCTVPGISQISRYDMDRWGDYWRFTNASVYRLLGEAFSPEQVEVEAYGNVLTALCFMHGLSAEDLRELL
jgi:SAM-dependent methyltransferase